MASHSAPELAIFLAGILMPAPIRYAALFEQLGGRVVALAKDLEVYATRSPAPDYCFDDEVQGISKVANAAGYERCHLYGHSGGGSCVLAYVAAHPERVLSLALDEPANDFSPEQMQSLRDYAEATRGLSPAHQMAAFVASQLRPGVEPPPHPNGRPPDWVWDRLEGIRAFEQALLGCRVSPKRYGCFAGPVYYSH
jgi:pimeloyl-ACP methyl ester carboxylesterase